MKRERKRENKRPKKERIIHMDQSESVVPEKRKDRITTN